ncbi:tRNA uridine-5-carboxymethylaminomethyl(34) synthesis enzyme MnmG [bacterium]|nr:tRNA uridine-5-carboxymethylaminomethyl(34) synthesis enzyme MnmG [bacterium]
MFHVKHFDVVVIGGGHAGAEAAAASARIGARTALISMRKDRIGVMSCNPAIGGLGKGHLVREIDALDGIMGLAADSAGIQFRLLNRRKGPAVQGPRTQADRKLYRDAIQDLLGTQSGLDVIEGEVVDLVQDKAGRVTGVELLDGSVLDATAVVLTAGTFLNGVIHIGDQRRSGGREGDVASIRLGQRLSGFGLKRGRLKTGTPPRLDGRTIEWRGLDEQPGDENPVMLSFLNKAPAVRQVACGITHTNERTHDIVRANLGRSAMYGGHIEGVGPRYCPSIEDKVVRFADKSGHQIFLEPEGLDDHTIYPNGISTSLPAEVQNEYVRSIRGLENVVILQPGYAIEYDYFDPSELHSDLQSQIPGLYFAGQINGTTGYEEAAAQGLVAGANAAAAALGRDPILFSRADSYIGVMLDDLRSRGVTEPYRMFTSRAEFRLHLRADNADQRLTPLGLTAGLVGRARAAHFQEKMSRLADANDILSARSCTPLELQSVGLAVSQNGARRSVLEVIASYDIDWSHVLHLVPDAVMIDTETKEQVWRDALYAQYLDRQRADAEALQRNELVKIPANLNFAELPGLSNELAAKLTRHRPENLAEAERIEGMTPAALLLILAHCRKAEPARAVAR